jgi:hypothetical protein
VDAQGAQKELYFEFSEKTESLKSDSVEALPGGHRASARSAPRRTLFRVLR